MMDGESGESAVENEVAGVGRARIVSALTTRLKISYGTDKTFHRSYF